MNFINRQSAIGAFVAATLLLGANAGADSLSANPSHNTLSLGAQLTRPYQAAEATLSEVIEIGRGQVVGRALDALGAIAAQLKQI